MRTTLDIADDVLLAAKELARRRKTTAGKVLSDLARQALRQASSSPVAADAAEFYGFQPFPSRDGLVTNDIVNRLRDEEDLQQADSEGKGDQADDEADDQAAG